MYMNVHIYSHLIFITTLRYKWHYLYFVKRKKETKSQRSKLTLSKLSHLEISGGRIQTEILNI